ncbi:hypothetical protein I317_01207 [Kwoniella heveanensis CBS 569]|nr:hypothetical protein I317_01207 [Kwoniella heveanensis CBS 569]
MWSTGLLLSVLVVARSGLSQQLAFSGSASASQSPSQSDYGLDVTSHGDISIQAETIVSTLSSSANHTITLHLLQRAKCIPLLAHIGNATFFAPTDQAWTDWADKHRPPDLETGDLPMLAAGWLGPRGLEDWMRDEEKVLRARIEEGRNEEEERQAIDNQNWALRQHLLYHMLNYTLPPSAFLPSDTSNVTIQTTLLYPLAQEPELPPTPEPGPPWLPRGGEGLLHGHGQRLRIAAVGSYEGGKTGKIGTDWNGEGGAQVWDGKGWETSGNQTENVDKGKDKDKDKEGAEGLKGMKWVRNGVVVGIEDVLDIPPSVEEIIRTHPSLSYLSHLISFDSTPSPLPSSFATDPHLTIFAPSNEAFEGAFDDIEKTYLEGAYGDEGVGRIVGGSVVLGIGKGQVGWSDSLHNRTLEATTGLALDVYSTRSGDIAVNGTQAEIVDIFASNGVIHIIRNLLLPENFTLLNSAEKTLLSLNATRFVSLLRSANLSEAYIGENGRDRTDEEAWTILAPPDDVLDTMDKWGGVYKSQRPIEDSSPLAGLLQYHFIPGRLLPSDIKDGMLLGTELRTFLLGGARQKLRVEVSERFDRDRNDWEAIGEGEVRFGGATVLGKPVKSGKSIIYLISSLLSPPDDVLQTAVADLQLSTFIAAVYAAELERTVKRKPATTYFMPRNRAFNQLGLAMRYLLLPEGKDELRKVIKYHVVDEVIYTPDIELGKKVFTTLEGGEVVLDRTRGKNGTISLHSPTKWDGLDSGENLPANGELRAAKVWHADALTDTGTIHTIDSVVLPADVKITIGKLIRGSKQSTMGDLMMRAGLGWILEGREPTSDEVQRVQLDEQVSTLDDDCQKPETGDPSDKDDDNEPKLEDLALPSYTVLVPTDKAFSALNLTHYLSDKDALLDLLKLHIIPSSSTSATKSSIPPLPPRDGQPLTLDDDLIYSTLLSGENKYGDVAFRATGDNSFIVGIKGARGGAAMGNSARIGQTGRASVRWKPRAEKRKDRPKKGKSEEDEEDEQRRRLWGDGMTLGGGVLMIDQVLIPYHASWFSRWGWLVLTLSGIGLIAIIAAVSFGWWWMTRGRKEEEEGYEPLEGEEEE